jgi:hypothetical protein
MNVYTFFIISVLLHPEKHWKFAICLKNNRNLFQISDCHIKKHVIKFLINQNTYLCKLFNYFFDEILHKLYLLLWSYKSNNYHIFIINLLLFWYPVIDRITILKESLVYMIKSWIYIIIILMFFHNHKTNKNQKLFRVIPIFGLIYYQWNKLIVY